MTIPYSGMVIGAASQCIFATSNTPVFVDREGIEYLWYRGGSWAFWVQENRMDDPLYIAEIRRMEAVLNSPFFTTVEERYSPDMPGMTIDEFQSWSDSIVKEIKESDETGMGMG